MRESFAVAITKAQEVIEKLSYSGLDMVDTNKVKDIVEGITGTKIRVGAVGFSSVDNSIANYGAMMRVDNAKKEAFIVLNIEKDAVFRRFSLVHELGHLITNKSTACNDKYTVSAHINYTLTEIADEACDIDESIENEQIANIFALLVLMPGEQFLNKMLEIDSITELADFYGVHKEAVLSRVKLEGC